MQKRLLGMVLCSCGLLFLGAATAKADSIGSWVDDPLLTYTNGFTTCPAYGCANVAASGTSTSATLTITSYLDGYVFDNFGFNLASGASITGWSITGEVSGPTLNGNSTSGAVTAGSYQLNGFGSFQYLVDTGKNGGSDGGDCAVTTSGGSLVSESSGCTFTITLNGTGFSSSIFQALSSLPAGDGQAEFAGHVANANLCTGFVGGGNVTGESNKNGTSSCATPAPEPSTSSMLLIGFVSLLALAGITRIV